MAVNRGVEEGGAGSGAGSPQGQGRAFFFQHPEVPSVLSSVAPGHSGKAHRVTCVDHSTLPRQTQVCLPEGLQVSPVLCASS